MKLLALESSTAYGGACLMIGDSQHEIATKKMRSHSEVLNVYIDELLKNSGLTFADLDAIGVGIGPGSFTGIRVAFNCAKTLAYAFDKPLIAVDSLLNLANGNLKFSFSIGEQDDAKLLVKSSSPASGNHVAPLGSDDLKKSPLIIPMINAYKNMVYTGVYKIVGKDLVCVQPPQVVRVQELDGFITEKSWCVGDGYQTYEKYFSDELRARTLRKLDLVDFPSPISCAQLAAQKLILKEKSALLNWTEITPLYLRASEAEENKKGIKYQAL